MIQWKKENDREVNNMRNTHKKLNKIKTNQTTD